MARGGARVGSPRRVASGVRIEIDTTGLGAIVSEDSATDVGGPTGVVVELLPGRAALVRRPTPQLAAGGLDGPALLVADVHLGKAATMAAGGLPVPGGLARRLATADLDRLSELLAATGARHLIILGDLLHARSARDSEVLDAVAAWRAGPDCAGVSVTLVRGNHDRHAGDPPEQWRMLCVDGPWPAGARGGPLALVHEPVVVPGRYTVGGHVHPALTLGAGGRAGGGERLRSPCFVVGRQRLILPAFGRFTGGAAWGPVARPGDTVALAGERAVVSVPGAASSSGAVVVKPENRAALEGGAGRTGAGRLAPR